MSQRQLAQASEDDIVRHAIKLNVFHTINFMLQHPGPKSAYTGLYIFKCTRSESQSKPQSSGTVSPFDKRRGRLSRSIVSTRRAHHRPFQVKSGELEIQGGIYDLGSGRVQLLGRHKLYARVSLPTNCHAAPQLSSSNVQLRLDVLRFLGQSPAQAKLLQSPAAAAPSLNHKFRGA